MKKKFFGKKILKFGGLAMSIFLAGCASNGGPLPPVVRVDHRGNVKGTRTPVAQVLRCQAPTMVVCESWGASKTCTCKHPGMVRGPRGF